MDAYREMTHSNQAREDDALFANIDVYDGKDPSKFEGWLDAVEQACNMTDRNLRKELMKKSSGAIRETLPLMTAAWTNDDVISKLRQDFSSMSTMNRAREELKDLKQLPGQPISSYMYKYGRIHFLATGNQAHNERYPESNNGIYRVLKPQTNEDISERNTQTRGQDPRCYSRPSTWQKRYLEESWRLNLLRDPAQSGSQVLLTISTNTNQRLTKYHVEDTITTITKEVTTKLIIIKVKMITMVRRIGTKTPKALTRRRMKRKNPRTRMCT